MLRCGPPQNVSFSDPPRLRGLSDDRGSRTTTGTGELERTTPHAAVAPPSKVFLRVIKPIKNVCTRSVTLTRRNGFEMIAPALQIASDSEPLQEGIVAKELRKLTCTSLDAVA